jgi:hypothetical protein
VTSTRSAQIQAAVLVATGAAVAVASLWGRRLPDRVAVARPRRRTPSPVPRSTGREILGADEALRRWGSESR